MQAPSAENDKRSFRHRRDYGRPDGEHNAGSFTRTYGWRDAPPHQCSFKYGS